MQTVLFHSTIFGPIHSRRLGSSLGVILMPDDGKVCTFDCLYCEAGYNAQGAGTTGLPTRAEVAHDLEAKLRQLKEEGSPLNVITFSGNGEPTLHPDFAGIIRDTIALRDRYFPEVKISVLSNATMIHKPDVVEALKLVDNNIQKLDSAFDDTVRQIDRPTQAFYSVRRVIDQLKQFDGHVIVQTMMLRGSHDGVAIDNTTPEEVEALVKAYEEVRPQEVMLYSIDRKTPEERLVKVPKEDLERIADEIRSHRIKVQVTA